VFEHSPRQI